MQKLYLLDAYALIFRAYYALFRNPQLNSKGENTSAIYGFVNTLEDILKKHDPTHIGIAFDPSGPTFRHEAFPEYKGQREETPEDIRRAVPVIKDIIRAYNIPILEIPKFEADDVIGTLAYQADLQGINTTMVTPDKDYTQIVSENVTMLRPGRPNFERWGIKEVCAKYGLENTKQVIDLLGLMGDTADNVSGCPGVGEKTASKLIKEFGSIDNLLKNTDSLKGALKKKITENMEKIRFSKFLVTIKTDVPIKLDMESLKRQKINEKALRQIFEEQEFRNLIKRILNKDSDIAPQNPQFQGNLFDVFQDNDKEDDSQRNLKRLKDIDHDYHLIENESDIKELCQIILTRKFVSLDTETTNVEPMRAKLVGMSFSFEENKAYYIPVPKEEEEAQRIVNLLKPVFSNENILKIGQNIKYDIIVLSHYGVEMKGDFFDTMLAHYVLQPEMKHNMDYLAEIYLDYETVHIEELIGPKGKNQKNMRDIDPKKVYEYACEDADITLKLKNKLAPELKKEGVEKLFKEIEMPLVPVLVEMECNGVTLDLKSIKQTEKDYSARLLEIKKGIFEDANGEFNINSPRQVGDILFSQMKITEKAKKTKSGQYVTSEEALENIKGEHPIVGKILKYRKLKKLLSTYITALPKLINKETGKIHSSFNQAVTATGRLSSSNPNLQNIPIRGEDGREIRKAFLPEDGCTFFSADYSQIELRIMAHLSEDPNMIEAFKEGQDIHAATSAKIFKKPIKEVTTDERRKAKTANFGIIYGITAFGLSQRMDVSRKEAQELIDGYFDTYPMVKIYMDRSIETCKLKGYVETMLNRKRYLKDINSHNAVVRKYAERNAINAPIQGSAADIIKVAMIHIYKRFKEEDIKSKLILQVHDELNFSVYPDEKEKVENIVLYEMQNAYKLCVPLIADSGWGDNWLEAH